jgi:long-chain acyl-CoA synthetase
MATTMTLPSVAERITGATTLGRMILSASERGEQVALRHPVGEEMRSITYRELGEHSRAIARGLIAQGLGHGDVVSLLCSTRAEWTLCEAGAVCAGLVLAPIYHTNSPEECQHVLSHSGARLVFCEDAAQAAKVEQVRAQCPALEHVVLIEGEAPGAISMAQLRASGEGVEPEEIEQRVRAVEPGDVATLVYTSGTTGAPKGVEHTHGGLMFGLNCLQRLAPVSPEGRVVSYLPMAHIAERYVSHYSSMAFGYTITACADPKQLATALVGARPSRFFGVPRIYEKLRSAVLGMIDAEPEGPLGAAVLAGLARVRAAQAGEDAASVSTEHEQLLARVRSKLGLDQVEWTGVAAAPTPYSVLEFFHAIGVPVAELWGMSECVLSTSNPPSRIKLGTVGIAIPGVEVKLAEDGEILVRGPNVTRRYRNDPERTAEAIDADGWLHSGDIAVADEDGYLKIVDRKKEIIINSAGKNMSPAHIECVIKEESPLIGQVVAIGDARQYVTALIVLDEEAAARTAEQPGLPTEIGAFAEHEHIRQAIKSAVERGNDRLARVEQIKAYKVLNTPWAPGGDELTPTMKLKRRVIAQKYATEIEALYA